MKKSNPTYLIIIALCMLLLSGCVGRVVGAAVDTTIEVAKVPFKVGGAIIDVATPDKKKSSKKSDDSESVSEELSLIHI